jgi:hypothetical protein
VRHRTDRTRGAISRESIVPFVFKLGKVAEQHWRKLNGFEFLAKVITGVRFRDGIEVRDNSIAQTDADFSITGNILQVTVSNSSTIQSATHPPVLGYTSWWINNVGNPLDEWRQSGPLSRTTQTIRLSYDLASICKCER